MDLARFDLPEFLPGSVWLVGAGPGDPGLLTVLALHALRHADVVVHDALIGAAVLALAGEGVERVDVGKRGGRPSPRQDEISLRLIALARQGRRVLRLKGGDPYMFGRGADEALALAEAGIPFRVVPGVTAGIGGLAYAGIPASHGASNAAVTFLTGHDTRGDIAALDWQALATGAPVLVLYMAVRTLGEIAARLIAGGRDPAEPVAVVSRASLPDQRVLETTLATCAAEVAAAGLASPAMVVVGQVVRLRDRLDWFSGGGEPPP